MELTNKVIDAAIVEFIGRCDMPSWICDESVKDEHEQDVYFTLASIQGAYELANILREKINED